MSIASELSLYDVAGGLFTQVGTLYGKIFFSLNPMLSVPSLVTSLAVAIVCVNFNRWRRRRGVKLKVLIRAFFPRRLFASDSTRADVGFFILNSSIFIILFGWAILSTHTVSVVINDTLVALFGTPQPAVMSSFEMSAAMTVGMFLAYELGYYTDHYLAHRIPFLWEFHKVHHAAEILTPVTNFRVHPVDTIVFYNILALLFGLTSGTLNYLFGKTTVQFSIADSNIILLAFTYLIGHLQHSHFWIAFTGVWGRLFLSPAHHQIHHSTNPAHFNRNLGNCLGVFDWLFGTLHLPSAKREKLSFGVEPRAANPHTVTEMLISPFGHALGHLAQHKDQGQASEPPLRSTAN